MERKIQMELLFQFGESMGLDTSYRAIQAATGESANNVRRIRIGEIANPGINTLENIARYFGAGLVYFDCQSEEDCRKCLEGVAKEKALSEIAQRADGLSSEGLQTILQMINHVRRLEGLPEITFDDLDRLENKT